MLKSIGYLILIAIAACLGFAIYKLVILGWFWNVGFVQLTFETVVCIIMICGWVKALQLLKDVK